MVESKFLLTTDWEINKDSICRQSADYCGQYLASSVLESCPWAFDKPLQAVFALSAFSVFEQRRDYSDINLTSPGFLISELIFLSTKIWLSKILILHDLYRGFI